MTKILVVEDEAPLRESIVDTLEFEGYDVVAAADGQQGWSTARREQPDLVVCDIAMPELNGYELLLKLREDPETASLPFIFLTARADRPFMRHGMELGADDYLTKPFTHADLLAAIRARLARHTALKKAGSHDLDRMKTEFVRLITHELRTPLVSITAVQDIVEQQLNFLSPAELDELLRIQRSGGQRLHHLVEQSVLLTEIRAGTLSRESLAEKGVPTAIWDVLTPAINLARRFAHRNREMAVYLDDKDGSAKVRCSPGALRHAVAEIIANALAYSPEGGDVRVEQWQADSSVWITVTDRGPGIPADKIDLMTQEFQQLDRDTNEQQGLGLGLAVARQIIDVHDGELQIKSNPAGGTVVIIRLPAWH
jgi:two-component system, sensor histidine kinase and response regulator